MVVLQVAPFVMLGVDVAVWLYLRRRRKLQVSKVEKK